MSPPAPYSAMSEAMKSPSSLIRRLSRGAQHRIGRRRASNASTNRDHSAGPVIVRRRSGSNKFQHDAGLDVSDLELDPHGEDGVDDMTDDLYPSRYTPSAPQSRPSIASNFSGDTLTPVVPALLALGTTLTKVTKRQKKRLFFRLDVDAGKFYWDPYKQSKQVYIDDVQAVREGSEAREYRESFQYGTEVENRWFTIIYTDPDRTAHRSGLKAIHLIADDDRTRQLWVEWINRIQRMRIQTMTDIAKGGEKSLKELWRRETRGHSADSDSPDSSHLVDFIRIKAMCRSLNVNCSDTTLRDHFNRADSKHLQALDYSQFRAFIKRLRKRYDIKHIFEQIKKEDQHELDLESVLEFLRNTQHIDVDARLKYWTGLFEKFCKRCRENDSASPTGDVTPMTMNFAAFQDFMMLPSVSGGVAARRTEKPLDRPLNEYFISSSHNTYLSGRQYLDECNTEAYVAALNRGCRCVEIDCWDGPDGKPLVRHGHSWTTPVLFSDCINVINDHAFRSSEYPLIISLEVHCSPPQQTVMTDIMKTVFGDKLVTIPLDLTANSLPSPEQLKGKILIKVKASSEELDEMAQALGTPPVKVRDSPSGARPININSPQIPYTVPLSTASSFGPAESDQPRWMNSISKDNLPSSFTVFSPSSSAEDSDVVSDKKKKKTTSNIIRVLGDLGVYCKGLKFTDFRLPEARSFNHIYSFAENTFEKVCRESKSSLEKHNQHHLMRVYPKNSRVMSDNFNPLVFWRRGVQMCAMNWQTNDLGMQINDAMFASGDDRTGYVVKPDGLQAPEANESSDSPLFTKPGKKRVALSLRVISAQKLPRPRNMNATATVNPFIEVEIFTAEDKERSPSTAQSSVEGSPYIGSRMRNPFKKRTQVIPNNGYNPTFNDSLSFIVETKYPSLVFVRWTVYNSADGKSYITNSPPLASYTAKLDSLQQGYRHIPLNNTASERFYFSTLFCQIHKNPVLSIDEIGSGDKDTGLSIVEGRSGILRRVFRTSSIRRKENRDQPTVVSAATFPPTSSSSGGPPSIRRVGSSDGSLHESIYKRS
jgi:phosphatidylinositol phospholipase C, delta